MDREKFEQTVRAALSQQPKIHIIPSISDPTSTLTSNVVYPAELELLKNAPNGWKFAAEYLLMESSCFEAKFFALSMIEDLLNRCPSRLLLSETLPIGPEERDLLRDTLMTYTQKFGDISVIATFSPADIPTFVRNKFAQIMALAMVTFYPNYWPTYFDDLLAASFHNAAIGSGKQLASARVDLLLRICRQIDEELVSKYVSLSEEKHRRNALIRDAMREKDVAKLVDAWYTVLGEYMTFPSEVVSLCMEVIGLYSSWIDISLIVTERFVSAFYTFLSSNTLRAPACDCVSEIISKKMAPIEKLRLIQSLQILNTFSSFNINDFEEEFLLPMARLVNTMGSELCMCWNEFETREVEQRSLAYGLINQAYPLLLKFLSSRHDKVSILVLDFSLSFLNILKFEKKRTGILDIQHQEALRALLNIIMMKMKIKESDGLELEDDEEEENELVELRKSLKVQLDNIAVIDEAILLDSMFSTIISSLENLSQCTYVDAELALKLMHTFGDILKGNQIGFVKTDSEISSPIQTRFTSTMHLIMRSGISSFPNPMVQIQYFENMTRYFRYFEVFPDMLGEALSSFLDTRGLRNSEIHIRGRVVYLFNRFVKSTRVHLEPFADQLLNGLRQFTDPLTIINTIGKDEKYLHDQLLIYETAGVLISSYHLKKKEQVERLEILLNPLYSAVSEILQKGIPLIDTEEAQTYLTYIHQLLMSLGSICKGAMMGEMEPQCLSMFQRSLELTLHVLKTIPNKEELKTAARFACHRYLNCLGSDAITFLPDIVIQLIGDCSMKDLADFIPLLNQVLFRFKDTIFPILDQILAQILERHFFYFSQSVISSENQDDLLISNDDVVSIHELRKAYTGFIQTVFNSNLGFVFSSERNLPLLPNVLQSIFIGAIDSKNPSLQKLSFAVLTKMIELWAGSAVSAITTTGLTHHMPLAGFDRFVYEQIVPLCFRQLHNPEFDFKDAQFSMVAAEIGLLLKVSYLRIGTDFLSYLRQICLPSVGYSTSMIEELCRLLQYEDMKSFKHAFKNFLRTIKAT